MYGEWCHDSGAPVPEPLSRSRIVNAAVGLIEREGADAVSMRRIAGELRVGVMSLYNHVPSKAALLDGVAEAAGRGRRPELRAPGAGGVRPSPGHSVAISTSCAPGSAPRPRTACRTGS
ncbi:hypothetical protein Misp01_69680 [Microtetraspora sp. NBRC 13810]|uniref:TetR/AcrR family transcriptional regulator n=1 Tax=Microtetraspora sp. NBRC 13810 TaxID=3030990 RepID=UPI0024A56C05|nr:TetR/AcrR family transcriptional regulator [Microtetraspora sp. NBRC 13810]GLW11840.1 hypothetical protein Misp01_69680 [Microtetraspora sp. NBRC 13810]